MKLKTLAALVATLGTIGSANAFALFAGENILEDDNREYLIKGTGNALAGTLQIGDRLRGVVEFGQILQGNGPGTINPITPELTGIFETQIVNIIGTTIIWGSSASFAATYGAGAMVALYTGGTDLNINGAPTIAAAELAATDGALWAVAGFGDVDDQWVSVNSNLDWGTVTTLGGATKVATVNYSLSLLVNNTGYLFNEQALDCLPNGPFVCAGNGKTDIVGSGDVLGGRGLTNGYGARSDIDVTLNAIPEPGSLALLGLGFAGLGASSLRRRLQK
jgi:hypothetical protein